MQETKENVKDGRESLRGWKGKMKMTQEGLKDRGGEKLAKRIEKERNKKLKEKERLEERSQRNNNRKEYIKQEINGGNEGR